MPRLFSHRSRLRVLWLVLAASAVATALAVHGLYDVVRREIVEQGARAAEQETAKALERVRSYTDDARRSIVTELAGFHVDGLSHALRQWDESNESIVGTFQWSEDRGFLPGSVFPDGVAAPEKLPALWRGFRERRAGSVEPPDPTGVAAAFRSEAFRTLDNPAFAAGSLGYQQENLDMLAGDGRVADPWAGWAGHLADAAMPWVFWYQAGPDAPVRGCFVDAKLLARQLRAGWSDKSLAQLELAEAGGAREDAAGVETALRDWLPAHVLRVGTGELFLEKESRLQFSALTVALLAGIFLVGMAVLAGASRREAREAERKTTFVSQVSHELRTPLTSIRMFADMLAAPGLPEAKRVKFATTISRESQRLGALIERLLTFNALENGKRPVTLAPVDVAALVRETLEETDGSLRAAGIETAVTLPEAPLFAETDASALKQALLNLLDNAIKYAAVGRIVRVSAEAGPGGVRVRVADAGPGIARHLRERVFEPFVQGGQSLTDKPAGVGLGLSIARGLLRAAGGDLVLLPCAAGAVFEIRLPEPSRPA